MNSEEQAYRPSTEFRERLEWELMRSYRRAERADGWTRGQRAPWIRVAVIAIVSIALGTTAGLASAQIGRSAEKDSLLAAAQADASLAKMRRDIARAEADDVARKVRVGVETEQAGVRASAELRAMELQLARVGLNIDEINASGHAPRDDLNAPLIGNRDFVKQRIEVEAASAQQRLTAAEGEQEQLERRVRVGAAEEVERLAGLVEVARARGAMAVLVTKLSLRAEFVQKGTPIDELARRLNEAQLRQDVVITQAGLALAQARYGIVEKQRKLGLADDAQVLRANLEVMTRQIELTRIAVRLRNPQ